MGAGLPNWPPLGDGHRDAVDGGDGILGPIRAWRREPRTVPESPAGTVFVRRAAGVGCDCEHRTGRDGFADGRLRLDHPLPSDTPEGTGCQPLRPVEQRAQQPVEHSVEQPRSERRRQWSAMAEDPRARTHSARVLVDLHDHTVPESATTSPGKRLSPTSTRSSTPTAPARPSTSSSGPLTRTTRPAVVESACGFTSTTSRCRRRSRRGRGPRASRADSRPGGAPSLGRRCPVHHQAGR